LYGAKWHCRIGKAIDNARLLLKHLLMRQQTSVINAIRAHLPEFGIVAPVHRILGMRANDRDLIRGGHYGQRSFEPHSKAEHMAAPTSLQT
jgi:hypothetical protein